MKFRLLAILTVCVLTLNLVHAQRDFIRTENLINDVHVNQAQNQAWFTSQNKIYLVDLNKFELIDSLAISGKDQILTSLEFFDSDEKVLKIKSFETANFRRSQNQEYPRDTTYYLSVDSLKVISKTAGNITFSQSNKSGNYSIGINNYQKWQDSLNNTYNFSRKGFIGAFTRPDPRPIKETNATGIIRDLEITGNNTVLIAYNIKEGSKEGVLLETRDFPELNILSSHFIEEERFVDEILIADNQEKLILSTYNYNQTYFDYFSIPQLEKYDNIPQDYSHGQLINNDQLWHMRDRDIILTDLKSGENLIEIWNNLTPFWMINGFEAYTDDEILIYGQESTNPNIAAGKTGLFRYNLEDNAIYSGSRKEQSTELEIVKLLPEEQKIQDNMLPPESYNVRSQTTENFLILNNERRLQIWEKHKKRKIHDLKFDNEIAVFSGQDENNLLIFKQIKGKSFDEFKVINLNLKSGQAKQKEIPNSEDFSFSEDLNFYNLISDKNIWIGINGDSNLWQLDLENFEISLIKDFSEENTFINKKEESVIHSEITQLVRIPYSDEFLITYQHTQLDKNYNILAKDKPAPKRYDYQDNSFKDTSLENNFFFATSERMAFYENEGMIYNVDLQTGSKIGPLNGVSGSLEDVLFAESSTYLLTTIDNTQDTRLTILNSDLKPDHTLTLDFKYQNFFLNKDGLNFIDKNNFYTYIPKSGKTIGWSNNSNYYINENRLSLSNDKLLFNNDLIIDLKSLGSKKFPSDISYKREWLTNGNILEIYWERYNVESPYFQFRILSGEDYKEVEWFSSKFKLPTKGLTGYPTSVEISQDQKYAAIYFDASENENRLFLLDLLTKQIQEKKLDYPIGRLFFSNETNQLCIVSTKDPFSIEMDFEPKTYCYQVQDLNEDKVYNSGLISLNAPNKMFRMDYDAIIMSDGTQDLKYYYSRGYLSVADYLPSRKMLIAGSNFGNLFIWDEENGSPQSILNLGTSEILKLIPQGDRLFVLLKSGKIQVVDLENQELITTIHIFKEGEKPNLAWITPDGHFKADKNSIRNFHFVSENNIYPVLNYEIFLNRPDVIMERLGYANEDLINLYHKAYQKRLLNNGLTENDKLELQDLPELYLENKETIKSVSEKKSLKLAVRSDKMNNLVSIKAYINGVPVAEKPNIDSELEIELNSGKNNISIIGFTNEGLQTNPLNIEVVYRGETEKSKIYYYGIGVSEYQEASMNLKYADVDVHTIAEDLDYWFKDQIQIDTLTNREANLDNILSIKSRLKNTGINDIVIISFSGHGLVGEDDQFYFATHNTNFNNPEESGLSYDQIYDLLSDIPARKKLLLIDACNSGEIDQLGELETEKLNNANVVQNIPEGAKGSKVVNSKNSNGVESSFEIMQSQFYDLERGNGSYIISAAGGREYAYEDEEWGNGVFTYSFLNSILELRKEDKPLKISELSEKIYNMVLDLTDGKQRPTSRFENIEWDWEID